MAKIIIFGIGDVGRLAHCYFTKDSPHEVVAFTINKNLRKTDTFADLPLVDFEELTRSYPPSQYELFIGIGYTKMNSARKKLYYQAKELGYRLPSYVSTKCSFLSEHSVGDNCFILEDNTIQPFVKIGNNVTLWSGNHIGHDTVIMDHCFLTSHVVVSGHCVISDECFIGVNATLRNSITIAPRTLIGAGSIMMKDTVADGVYLPERAKLFDKKSYEIDL